MAQFELTEWSEDDRLRPSLTVARFSGADGRALLGAAFTSAYFSCSPLIADAIFDHGVTCLRDCKARVSPELAQDVEALWRQALAWGWLIPPEENDLDSINERIAEDLLEAEVGTPGLWNHTRHFYFEFLRRSGLRKTDWLLDVGCGNLRIGVPVVQYLDAGRYVGLDARNTVLDQGRAQIARHKLTEKRPKLLLTDCFRHPETAGQLFDVIIAIQLIYHLRDSVVIQALDTLMRQLMPNGRLYCNVQYGYSERDIEAEGSWKAYPFIRRKPEWYEMAARHTGLVVKDMGKLSTLGYGDHFVGGDNNMLLFERSPRHR